MKPAPAPPAGGRRSLVIVALCAWVFVSIFMLSAYWQDILTLDLSDPDDAMRMAQVRDLLAGQGWWDLMQYRINPAHGGALMHWSRIVDAPIAGGILLLDPFVGRESAERIVMAGLPVLLSAGLYVSCALGFRHLPDRRIAYFAPILAIMMGFALARFRPLHVDHHGWQILLAMIMLWQAIRPPSLQAGLIGGFCAAVLLAISIEGLPIVTIFAGLAALRWALHDRPADRDRLCGCMGALAAAGLLVQFISRGPDGVTRGWCDALSAPYLAAFVVAALAVLAIVRIDPVSRNMRIALLGCAALSAAATVIAIDPICAKGPFATLDPYVRRYWYLRVLEGLPVTEMKPFDVTFVIVPSVLGIVGALLAWRASKDADARRTWTTVLVAMVGAVALSLLVMRTVATAHIYVIPGCAWLAITAWDRARSIPSALPRVLSSAFVVLLLPLPCSVAAVTLLGVIDPAERADEDREAAAASLEKICLPPPTVAALRRIRPTTLMAPLDMSPSLLFWTQHRVIATGHHRNKEAMSDTIRTFISTPDVSSGFVREHGATYVIYCPTAPDFTQFRRANKSGLAAALWNSKPPAWLEKVPIGNAKNARQGLAVWKVKAEALP